MTTEPFYLPKQLPDIVRVRNIGTIFPFTRNSNDRIGQRSCLLPAVAAIGACHAGQTAPMARQPASDKQPDRVKCGPIDTFHRMRHKAPKKNRRIRSALTIIYLENKPIRNVSLIQIKNLTNPISKLLKPPPFTKELTVHIAHWKPDFAFHTDSPSRAGISSSDRVDAHTAMDLSHSHRSGMDPDRHPPRLGRQRTQHAKKRPLQAAGANPSQGGVTRTTGSE